MLKAKGVSVIAAGSSISAAATIDGKLFTWGSVLVSFSKIGNFIEISKAGTGNGEPQTEPKEVTKLPGNTKIVQIETGVYHTVLLTDDGKVYTYGSGNVTYNSLGVTYKI